MNYSQDQVLSAARIGFEFEFLSDDKPLNIARELSELLGVKVVVPMNADKLNKLELKYHTPITVTPNLFKLESDFSGGPKMKELVTGPLNYKDARTVLLKVLNWIDTNAWTTERAACQLNISFDEWKINMAVNLEHMNVLKFCLNFNENYVWKRFPNRQNSVYAKSIKHIVTNNIFNIKTAGTTTQFVSAPNKYYSVNFTKIDKGYVEFRGIGGADYQKKKQEIVDIMDFSILSLFSLSQRTSFNRNDNYKLQKILDANTKYLQIYKNPELIRTLFPHVNLSLNLQNDMEVIKTMWSHTKDKIVLAMLKSGCEKMSINYDSDEAKVQIKEAAFKFAELENIELINCTGFGIFTKCNVYDSKLETSNFMESVIEPDTVLTDCKIEKTVIHKGCIIRNCYVANDDEHIINCKVEGGILRKCTIGSHAVIADDVEKVDVKEQEPQKYKGTFGVYKLPDDKDFKQAQILFPTKK